MLALQIFLFIIGLALLVKGADWFVDGSSGIARKCNVSPLVIGLTIVAFGTSAPELAVSVASAIGRSTDLAIGNVVGSNIANILLILGLSAIFRKLPVQKISLRLDFPVLLLASVLLILLGAWDAALQWWDGLILLVLLAAYFSVLLVKASKDQKKLKELGRLAPALSSAPNADVRGESASFSVENVESESIGAQNGCAARAEEKTEKKPKNKFAQWFGGMKEKTWFLVLLVAAGLGMVVGGGTLLVNAATYIAEAAHVSQRIIALTVVAIGTSLPELVTSVVAAAKGETDIAVGNIIGSNILNILLVAGAAALFCPLAFTQANLIDALVALGAAVLLYVLALFKRHELGLAGGAVLLACFIGYYAYLFIV